MSSSGFQNTNAFRSAGQDGSFFYYAVGNQTSTFLVLMLAFVLLFALIFSERRYRELMRRFVQAQGTGKCQPEKGEA